MPQFEQVSVFGSLIFWSLLSFAILFFLLKKFAFPPILEALEEREKKIRKDIEDSEKLKEDAQTIKKDLEETLKAAHGKAETIVQLAQDEAKKFQEKNLQETEAKVRQVQKDAEQEIQSSRDKLLQEMRSYTAALTIASTEKFLKKALGDEDKKRLVEESIEQVIQELEKRQRN
ncbi:MAG: F0F1 ATP synthase subunit B [Nitrospina sp.]|jgi:F-type H+-transporting ATPase subunit b|nr:F0F1 ATP synthase subunit B [Nitrospina sp.]MBT3876248.1 F0F1 ATP synthase subunit B [Nitrospina sp.]MBT4047987.1 F0F1 ATP synthase subunit B [Nitrospina sp.]MBT4555946.1 F0F1 ATP synthase subunit B [Nitrospina sp.]MBT5348017.1 F0F1 ATP synthase subunit B [Nitrospina sp.]